MNILPKHLISINLIILLISFNNYQITAQDNNFNSQNKHQITVNNIDSIHFSGIKKILLPGISRTDFLDVCAIQWMPIETENNKYEDVKLDLHRQILYNEFDTIIKKLAISKIVKASRASLQSVDGRSIYCLEIGKGLKTITFTAGIHAREVANPQYMLKFATELINRYETGDTDIIELLNNVRVIILPCINPDGYEGAISGKKVFNNENLFLSNQTDSQIASAKSNANGVDLNRNFPTYSASLVWENEEMIRAYNNTQPSLNYFAGFTLGSENETKVAMNFLMRYVPISFRYIDFHSAGRLIYAGKPNLSDEFNFLSYKSGKIIEQITKYSLLGTKHEGVGLGSDGTITDFAAEVATGFVYNELLGRLAPHDSIHLVRKTEQFAYPCSVNTVETIKTSKREGYGLLRTSTPAMHENEWIKYKLYKLLLSLITE